MEKIMNVQMPGSLPAGTKSRSVQNTDAGDGFLTMLKQKQETPKDLSETEEPAEPVKNTESQTREEPKKTPADDQEPKEDVQQLAQELAAQQAAAQNTVVIPDWQEQPVQPDILPEVMAAVEEIPAELPAEQPEISVPVSETRETRMPEKAEVPVKAAEVPAKADESQTQQPVHAVQEAQPEERQEAFSENAGSRADTDTAVSRVPEPAGGSTAEPQEVTQTREEVSQINYGPAEQKPVVQNTESFASVSGTEEGVIKTTVEELPQELGKALTSGQTAGSQTLTVELEPAALGKLTIKVVYEAGRTAVSIMASNPKTLELLSEKASEIASILKERTGEETVIYTQEPQQQEPDQYEGRGGGSGQGEQKQHEEEERQQTESFAQQLRLGLV